MSLFVVCRWDTRPGNLC